VSIIKLPTAGPPTSNRLPIGGGKDAVLGHCHTNCVPTFAIGRSPIYIINIRTYLARGYVKHLNSDGIALVK